MLTQLKRKLQVYYISAIDRVLDRFNQENPLSESQEAEFRKHAHIARLRDHPQSKSEII